MIFTATFGECDVSMEVDDETGEASVILEHPAYETPDGSVEASCEVVSDARIAHALAAFTGRPYRMSISGWNGCRAERETHCGSHAAFYPVDR